MKIENDNKLVALAQFLGFRIERLDDINLALVRTKTPIIQINEESELSGNARKIIKAVFDSSTEYNGKDDVQSRIDAFAKTLTDYNAPFWANIKKFAPEASFNDVRRGYFNSVESFVNSSEKTVREFTESNPDEEITMYYEDIFKEYNKLRDNLIEHCRDQAERN